MRLRDLCAGSARTTSHSFFSAEFIEGHVTTTFVRGSAATDSSRLGWRGSLLWEFPAADAACHFRRWNILPLHLGRLDIATKAFPNLRSKNKTCVGIDEDLTKLLLDHFADKRLQFVD
jgi:hypothetical protein